MKRDIITIEDLSSEEINSLFDVADKLISDMTEHGAAHRIRGRRDVQQQYNTGKQILTTLFYEPSTRTRFSFESAMIRLGGHVLSADNPKMTSVAKGETLADTVRVLQNYCDILVIRHPSEGAARLAAEFASVPIINAGDGGHEHPTQTLCDLYTLRREKKKLEGLNILLMGDLKNGRTIHSLVYALARFRANMLFSPSHGLGLPAHVRRRLVGEFGAKPADVKANKSDNLPNIDVAYLNESGPHQPRLFPITPDENDEKVSIHLDWDFKHRQFDVCYVTRFQKERVPAGELAQLVGEQQVVNGKFLSHKIYEKTSVLHPLPRVDELGYDLDNDPRGIYFKQAGYGVPVRMALIAALLGVGVQLGERRKPLYPEYRCKSDNEISCGNTRCITHEEAERRTFAPGLWIIGKNPLRLRCIYCEHEVETTYIGDRGVKRYYTDISVSDLIAPDKLVIFSNEQQAIDSAFRKAVRNRAKRKTPSKAVGLEEACSQVLNVPGI